MAQPELMGLVPRELLELCYDVVVCPPGLALEGTVAQTSYSTSSGVPGRTSLVYKDDL